MRRFDTISFLSDYGRVDEFVGVCHSVIRTIAPEVTVVDVTHDLPRHDVRAGGLALARAAQYLCPGVVVAVVDPGVGTSRRRVAIEVGGGQSILVGPDNGLLAPAVALVGGATRAVELTAFEFHLPAPGGTFDGRDVFCPVAAHLCNGVPLDELGTEVDPVTLLPAVLPVCEVGEDRIETEVLWVDHYGNVQLNVDPVDLDPLGPALRVRVGDDLRTARRVAAFADIPPGELGVLVDSYGMVAVAVERQSAAAELGVHTGDQIVLEARDAGPGVETRVELGPRPAS